MSSGALPSPVTGSGDLSDTAVTGGLGWCRILWWDQVMETAEK